MYLYNQIHVGQMDILITKRKKPKFVIGVAVIAALVILTFSARFLWMLSQTDLSLKKETLVFGEVKKGDFIVNVRGTGRLRPENIQWLSTGVQVAKVERVVVKPGIEVIEGDLIVELSNPQLLQKLSETEWAYEETEADVIANRIARESALLDQESAVLDAKLNYESSLLKYEAELELLKQSPGSVSSLTHKKTRLETHQYKQRWDISKVRYTKMQENSVAQTNASRARLNNAKRILERAKQQVNDLMVRATMDSVVLEVPLEVGQRISFGSNIAKLAQKDRLFAELEIPEIQIRGVAAGQKTMIDTRSNKLTGFVSRVDPAVVNGKVKVEITITAPLPPEARPDLSVDGEIKITEIQKTLYVQRPLFSQSFSESILFKVSKDETVANPILVSMGAGSINEIQILEGLEAGDKIIVSNPTRFEDTNQIRIN